MHTHAAFVLAAMAVRSHSGLSPGSYPAVSFAGGGMTPSVGYFGSPRIVNAIRTDTPILVRARERQSARPAVEHPPPLRNGQNTANRRRDDE